MFGPANTVKVVLTRAGKIIGNKLSPSQKPEGLGSKRPLERAEFTTRVRGRLRFQTGGQVVIVHIKICNCYRILLLAYGGCRGSRGDGP
jgi:hypothetical protein